MEYPNTASNDESSSTRSHCNANDFIDDIKVCQVCSMKGNELVFYRDTLLIFFYGITEFHYI